MSCAHLREAGPGKGNHRCQGLRRVISRNNNKAGAVRAGQKALDLGMWSCTTHALKGLLQGFCLENEGQGGLGYMCGERGSGQTCCKTIAVMERRWHWLGSGLLAELAKAVRFWIYLASRAGRMWGEDQASAAEDRLGWPCCPHTVGRPAVKWGLSKRVPSVEKVEFGSKSRGVSC